MSDFILRPATEGDLEQIVKIWNASFGDSREFILSLAENCRLIENGVCAETDGKGRAFMFAFDGLEFFGRKASYIYALCTQSEYRRKGMGRAVAIYAAQQANKRGAELVFLRPGDKKLADWYSNSIGAVSFAHMEIDKIPPVLPSAFKAEKIGAEEYLEARSKCLWSVPSDMLLAESIIHRHYGGAFLRCGESFVCAEKCGDGLYLREIIGDDAALAISAAAEHFGVNGIYLPRPCEDGIPLMFIPPFCPENTNSIPLMPFTLD